MRHGWTILSEMVKGPIFFPFSRNASPLAGIAWFVRRLNYGTFPDIGKS